MIEFFTTIPKFLSSFPFLFTANTLSFFIKVYVLVFLLIPGWHKTNARKPLIFIIFVLLSAMSIDFVWILWLSRQLFIPSFDQRIVQFFVRLAWAGSIVQYQSLALFIESLIEKTHKVSTLQKIFIGISLSFSLVFIYLAFFQFNNAVDRSAFEFSSVSLCSIYVFSLIFITLLINIRKIYVRQLPRILKRQLKIIIKYLIGPIVFADFIQCYPFSVTAETITGHFGGIGISTGLISYAIFYSSRKIMGLRFLNVQNHVQSHKKFNFIDDFKNVLERLGIVSSVTELHHITQNFFKEAFAIPATRTTLYIRRTEEIINGKHEPIALSEVQKYIENFICDYKELLYNAPFHHKIWINDEIVFNTFYDENKTDINIATFLANINADIFLPIYQNENIIAYILVERDARNYDFYSNIERDEMLVFASYLGNIINLLQNRNLTSLIEKEKNMQEKLYRKHREIQQYKESIRSFLRDSQQRKTGIIFYNNRRFIYGNKESKELINVNLNSQEAHPLTQAIKKLTHQVEEYKTSHSTLAHDTQGQKIVLCCIPNLEQDNLIITVSYPEVSDVIKKQIELLKNPSEWDYLLYLETTKTGQLINRLIPGNGEQLLNFKIELLKTSLSKKALLLEMPEEDLTSTVEILHNISLREELQILKLSTKIENSDIAIKLFGINPIYGISKEKPLLSRLDTTGTLFIQNVELLDMETQNSLAEFIKFGFYHLYKSDQKVTSNVRIICSTNQNLAQLTHENKFSKALLNELKKTTLSMPSLLNLSNEELDELAEGFSQQEISNQELADSLSLSEREKNKLHHIRATSLQKFKLQIKQLITDKSKKTNTLEETDQYSDPTLIHAARLGKKALKDPKIMTTLWNKFQNQNKIAEFLGVNRSSVNRRCKEYQLGG